MILKDHRHRIGSPLCLSLEKLVNAFGLRTVPCRIIPFHEESALFVVHQERELGNSLLGIGGNALDQHLETAEHTLDGDSLEEIGAVIHVDEQLTFELPHRKRQVEFRCCRPGFDRRDLNS